MFDIYHKHDGYYILFTGDGFNPYESGPFDSYNEAWAFANANQDIRNTSDHPPSDNGFNWNNNPSFGG